MIIAGYIDIF